MADSRYEKASSDNGLSIDEQAGKWLMLLKSSDCTHADINDHKVWLNESLAHYRAYRELEEVWELTADFGDNPEILSAREEALEQCSMNDVAPQVSGAGYSIENKGVVGNTSLLNRFSMSLVALAASFMLVVFGINSLSPSTANESGQAGVYQTSVGERRTFALEDGSTLTLDTETRLTTHFSENSRLVELEKGQARFDVAHDKARPFIVQVDDGTITALGTAFVVRKEEGDVTVTLIEGSVAVAQLPPNTDFSANDQDQFIDALVNPREMVLEAGEQVAYSKVGLSHAEQANLDQATAWQQGRLVFDEHTLITVIKELNRYSRRKIILEDESLNNIKITGVFKTGNQRKAIQALQSYFSITVNTNEDGNLVLVSSRKSNAG